MSHLQPSVECPLNGHTLARMGSICGDGCDERIQLIFLLLQFLHQALDGPLGKRLTLATLSVAHQAVHDAQAGIVAGRCVGDGHFSFSFCVGSLYIFIELYTASHHPQDTEAVTIFTGLIRGS